MPKKGKAPEHVDTEYFDLCKAIDTFYSKQLNENEYNTYCQFLDPENTRLTKMLRLLVKYGF